MGNRYSTHLAGICSDKGAAKQRFKARATRKVSMLPILSAGGLLVYKRQGYIKLNLCGIFVVLLSFQHIIALFILQNSATKYLIPWPVYLAIMAFHYIS